MAQNLSHYHSLDDFLTASELTVDGRVDDGWGADVFVKGREIDAAILFADIRNFSGRTKDMSPAETLVYVNTFFAWITEEALRRGSGVVDKYIGDEVMVVFSGVFGSEDPFEDAIRTAQRICENDVLDYQPHIGIAAGPVMVGYVGTPLRHNCSVFGAAVAMAARCAGAKTPDIRADHVITFPAGDWADRELDRVLDRDEYRDPETGETVSRPSRWAMTEPFSMTPKNLPETSLRTIHDQGSIRINQGFSAESRARDALKWMRENNRYWPQGRTPKG